MVRLSRLSESFLNNIFIYLLWSEFYFRDPERIVESVPSEPLDTVRVRLVNSVQVETVQIRGVARIVPKTTVVNVGTIAPRRLDVIAVISCKVASVVPTK